MIVARYNANGERVEIEAAAGKYFNRYGVMNGNPASIAGAFASLSEAEAMIKKHRPGAVRVNNMCIDCISDCPGTPKMHFSGCIWKEFEKDIKAIKER